MVERVTGRSLPELLDERLFKPMGIDHAEWDRVASGSVFGFHGLHLTTEAVAAFGELMLRGGLWGDRRLVPSEWVELATTRHIDTLKMEDQPGNPDYLFGYGYQFWMSRHGYHGDGSFGQQCVVVPSHDLVVAVTGAHTQAQALLDAIWECLLPGMDDAESLREDAILAERLSRLSLAPVLGSADQQRSVQARIAVSEAVSALPDGATVIVDPVDGGWILRIDSFLTIDVGHGEWRESSRLGRSVVATGAWQGNTFVAELYVITTPHRVRLVVDADAGTAVATWNIVPLTSPSLALHLRSPLMTRPDVA
jgi:hypothetical protein